MAARIEWIQATSPWDLETLTDLTYDDEISLEYQFVQIDTGWWYGFVANEHNTIPSFMLGRNHYAGQNLVNTRRYGYDNFLGIAESYRYAVLRHTMFRAGVRVEYYDSDANTWTLITEQSLAEGAGGPISPFYINPTIPNQFLEAKIYRISVRRNNELVHDLLPVINGFTDVITGTTYTVDDPETVINGPLSVPAYTVIFDSNGGAGTMAPQSIEIDVETPLSLNTFTNGDNVFIGWGTNAAGPVEYNDGSAVLNLAEDGESITLYAQWRGAFGIDIQRNNSENNKLHKSVDTLLHVTGTLKATTSIIDPTFIIACDLEDVTGANYISVPVFGRSYYIKDIVSYANGLVGFSCHVDALSSFAAEIEANKGIVRRGESRDTYNLYINDGSLVSYQNPYVLTEPFPSGFTGASFVLATAGHAGP